MRKLRLGLAVVFANSLLVTGCGKDDRSAQQYIESAIEFYDQGDVERARVQFRNALRKDAYSGEAYYYLSMISEAKGDMYVAYADIQRAKELAPQDMDIAAKAAEYLVLTAQFSEGITAAQEILERNPQHVAALTVAAAGMVGLQDYAQALEYVERGLVVARPPYELLALKVIALKFLQEYDAALKVLDLLHTEQPEAISYVLLELDVRQQIKDVKGMEVVLRRLVALKPQNERYVLTLAQQLYHLDLYEKAFNELEQFNIANPNNTLVKKVMIELVQEESPEKAGLLLERFLVQLPMEPGLRFLQISRLLADGDMVTAKQLLVQMADASDTDVSVVHKAHIMLAQLHFQFGEFKDAMARVNTVIKNNPYSEGALLLRAKLYLRGDDYASALKDVDALLIQSPKQVEAWGLKAYILGQLARVDEQNNAYAQLLVLAPNNEAALDHQVQNAIRHSRFVAAESFLGEWAKHAKDPQPLRLRWLQLYLAAKNWGHAQKQLDALVFDEPMRWQGAFFQAQIFAGQKQYDKAFTSYKQVVALEPQYIAAYDGLFLIAQQLDFLSLERWAKSVIGELPAAVPAYVFLSGIYQVAERWQDSQAVLARGVSHNKGWVQGYKLWADAFLFQNDVEGALKVYKASGDDVGFNAFLLLGYADTLALAERYDEASKVYEQLIQRKPDSLSIRNNYASFLLAHDDVRSEQAIKKAYDLTRSFVSSDNPALMDTLAWAQYYAGEVKSAEHLLGLALEKAPEEATILYHYASALAANGKVERAQVAANKALKLIDAGEGRERLNLQVKQLLAELNAG